MNRIGRFLIQAGIGTVYSRIEKVELISFMLF